MREVGTEMQRHKLRKDKGGWKNLSGRRQTAQPWKEKERDRWRQISKLSLSLPRNGNIIGENPEPTQPTTRLADSSAPGKCQRGKWIHHLFLNTPNDFNRLQGLPPINKEL